MVKRRQYYIVDNLDNSFHLLNIEDRVKYILCPVDALRAKLSNNYLRLLVLTRTLAEQGKSISNIGTLSLASSGIIVTKQT